MVQLVQTTRKRGLHLGWADANNMKEPQVMEIATTYIDVEVVPRGHRTRDALNVSAHVVSPQNRTPQALQAQSCFVAGDDTWASPAPAVVPPLHVAYGKAEPEAAAPSSPLRLEALALARAADGCTPAVPPLGLFRGRSAPAASAEKKIWAIEDSLGPNEEHSPLRPEAGALAAGEVLSLESFSDGRSGSFSNGRSGSFSNGRSGSLGRIKAVSGCGGPAASSFIAHVLCDFNPTIGKDPQWADGLMAMAVRKGDYVTVLDQHPAPDGWCYCQVSRESGAVPEEGLVPWFFLTAVDDPAHKALAMAFTSLPRAGIGAAAPPAGIPPEGLPELVRSSSLLISVDPRAKISDPPDFMPPELPGSPRRSSAKAMGAQISPGPGQARAARDEEGAWLDVTVRRSDGGKGALGHLSVFKRRSWPGVNLRHSAISLPFTVQARHQ